MVMKPGPLPLALAVAGALLVPASSAVAAPHWSAPVPVIPGTGTDLSNGAPQAFVAGGRSVVVAGSGENALLARGSATNVFTDPLTVATAPGGNVGTDAAVGGDGTVAVAWASGGTGHVSIVTPGGSVLPQADLPGGGVNAIGVGIASDGSTIVAYRTKESASAYSLRVAVAAAGSSSFGEPALIESGAATDSIDVATGPGGAAAVAYRQLAGKYRARVAVRPAGAGAFEAGQPMTVAAADRDDFSPRVAFDSDGTVVAAWGSPGGAQYALRAPGASAFGAGVPLGAGAAYSVDLQPTPAGVAAVAVAGDGRVRVAVQNGVGAGFSEPAPIGPAYTSQFSDPAAVTVAPGGLTTVVSAVPTDGAVHAVDVGGGDQVIGYGTRDGLTPVSVASSGDRTVAAWTDGTGAIVAATRSESARPATPSDLGPAPSARDTKGPKLRYVSGTKTFRVTTKTTRLKFKVRCSEACKLLVTGSLRTQLSAKSRRKIAPLPAVATKKLRSGTQTVTLKIGTLARRDLVAALRKKRGGQLYLVLEAYDASSNATRTRLQLTVKPATTKKGRR
jgi:hypothetical protein